MPPTKDELTDLAKALRIEVGGPPQPGPGDVVSTSVGPPLPVLEMLKINEFDLDLTATVQPLTVLSKNVQLADPRPETPTADGTTFENLSATGSSAEILGETPVVIPRPGGFSTVPGVGGVLTQLSGLVAKITGQVPIPETTKARPTLTVVWTVSKTKTGAALQPGTDFLAPEGTANPTASFILPPGFAEDQPARPESASWWIRAEVTLSVGPIKTDPVSLPPVEIKVPRLALTPLVVDRYRVSLPSTTAQPASSLSATLTEFPSVNALGKLLSTYPGITVQFPYELTKSGQAPAAGEVVGASPAGALTPAIPLTFFLQPQVVPLATDTVQESWALGAVARLSGLPGATLPTIDIPLPPIPLLQNALAVPQLVLGFDGKSYGPGEGWFRNQAAYVFLSPGNPAVTGMCVDRKSDRQAQELAKEAVLTQLRIVKDLVAATTALFPTIPALRLAPFERVLAGLANANWDEIITDGTPACHDLGARDWSWNDRISSLAVIGPPGGRTLSLFQDATTDGRSGGRRVSFGVPAGELIATYWTIDVSWGTEADSVAPAGTGHGGSEPEFNNEATASAWD